MEWLSWSQPAWVVISTLLCAGSVTLGTVITEKDELELEANIVGVSVGGARANGSSRALRSSAYT